MSQNFGKTCLISICKTDIAAKEGSVSAVGSDFYAKRKIIGIKFSGCFVIITVVHHLKMQVSKVEVWISGCACRCAVDC